MRVAVISAEAVPYSKTGGLGDVAGALPKALKQIGIDSILITPCYWQTKGEYLWNTAIDDLWVDWHGGFAAVELAARRHYDPYWRSTRTVFSIHNMAYQGGFGMGELPALGFTSDFARNSFNFNGYASAMKAGLEVSDTLSAVSKRY